MVNNSSNARNWVRDITNASVNKIMIGGQRNSSSRDSRGFQESTDFGQNFVQENIQENLTMGFSVTGV